MAKHRQRLPVLFLTRHNTLHWSTVFTYAALVFAVFMDNIRHVQSFTVNTTSGIEVSNTTSSSQIVDTTTFGDINVLQTDSQTSTESTSSMSHNVIQSTTLNSKSTVGESTTVTSGSTPSQLNPLLTTQSSSSAVPKSTSGETIATTSTPGETITTTSTLSPTVVNSAQATISPQVPNTTTDKPAYLTTSTLIPITTSQASTQTVSSIVTNTDPVTIDSRTSHDAASTTDPYTAQETTSPYDSSTSPGSVTTSSHQETSVASHVIATQSGDITTTLTTVSQEKTPMFTTPTTLEVTTSRAPTTIKESMQPTTEELYTTRDVMTTTASTTQTTTAPPQGNNITPRTTISLTDILTTKSVPKTVKITTKQETHHQGTTPRSKMPPTQSLQSTTTDVSTRDITNESHVSGSVNVTAGPSSDDGLSAATIAIITGSIVGFWIILGPIICVVCRLRDRAKERRLRYNRKESRISNFEDMIMAELAKAQNRKCETNYSYSDIKLDLEETQKLNSQVPVSEL